MRPSTQSLRWAARWLGPKAGAALLAIAILAAGFGVAMGASRGDTAPSAPAAASARVLVPAAVVGQMAEGKVIRPHRGGAEYYRRTAREHVTPEGAAGFLPLYREAGRRYFVNWRLIASIHRQETAFSAAPSTYRGLNDFGCCAGPMQFNVTNGPVSTWKRYRQAFRKGHRPKDYPHQTRSHPSIYDDFDAIMAAGSLLSDSGAGPELDGGAWSAAYSYYGHDLFGVTYASEILARALAWQRGGFCPNCALDEGLVAKFDDDYGVAARKELVGAERHKKDKKRKKHKKGKKRRGHKGKGDQRKRDDSRSEDRPGGRRPPKPTKTKPSPGPGRGDEAQPAKPSPTPPAPPSAAPPATAPPPKPCSPLQKLLQCR